MAEDIEAFDETRDSQRKLALFPADRAVPEHAEECGVQVKLKEFTASPAAPVGCVLGILPALGRTAREGGSSGSGGSPIHARGRAGYHVLMSQVAYRLIDPGGEWRTDPPGSSPK